MAAYDGTVGLACVDFRVGGNGLGELVSLLSGVCRVVDETGFL